MSPNQIAHETKNLSLFCNASGFPTPKIVWKKIGKAELKHHGDSLSLKNLSSEDTGTYICEASNGIEMPATETANVVVLC